MSTLLWTPEIMPNCIESQKKKNTATKMQEEEMQDPMREPLLISLAKVHVWFLDSSAV